MPAPTRHACAATVLLLLSAGPGQAAPPEWGYIGLQPGQVRSGDVQAFKGASLPIGRAIAAAAGKAGGKVLEIGFGRANGASGYDATVLTGGQLRFLHVDAGNGNVSDGKRPPVSRAQLTAPAIRDLAAVETAPVDLSQAIADAEKATSGKAISAGIEQLQGRPQYLVRTVANGRLRNAIVDPVSGRTTLPG
jgi:uncharacterized membrane protein YkoI